MHNIQWHGGFILCFLQNLEYDVELSDGESDHGGESRTVS